MAFSIVPCRDNDAETALIEAKRKGTFPPDAKLFRDRPNMAPPASHEFVGIIAVYAGTAQPVRYPVGVPKS
jgi:hypothetical protein